MSNRTFIWLIGENKGTTHNNNSYYFWRTTVSVEDNIAKYYILEENKQNQIFRNSLPKQLQDLVVWKDSLEHYLLYSKADMGIVSLSYLDVVPEKFMGKAKKYWAQFPIIYLQHGVIGQKKIGYKGNAYNGNLCRFVYYNRHIKDTLIEENAFKDTQLLYGVYHPRYIELLKRSEEVRRNSTIKNVLWFVTWREYDNNSLAYRKMIAALLATFESSLLRSALQESGIRITLCLHRQMIGSMAEELSQLDDDDYVDVVNANDVDVLSLIARSDALITDFSSVAYDFAFLEKPVILYVPDFDDYSSTRGLYYEADDVKDCFCGDLSSLIAKIRNEEWCVPKYFRDAFPKVIEYDKIRNGAHIHRIYKYLVQLQHSEITFLGYNFYGTGGTVSATRALSEALFDKGFLVRMLSLKGPMRAPGFAKGIRYSRFYTPGDKSRIQRLRLLCHGRDKEFDPIRYDCLKGNLVPYVGYALKHYLASSTSSVIVSTRESFHSALLESAFAGKKGYFWHTRAKAIEEIYPGLLDSFDDRVFHGSLFTTSENEKELKTLGVAIPDGIVLGNTLGFDQILNDSEVFELRRCKYQNRAEFYQLGEGQPFSSEHINCVTLMRLSEERKDAISRIFELASYLMQQGMEKRVRLYVYGDGELFDYFITELYKRNLQTVVQVMGKTSNPASILRKADYLIDFSDVQSFGMPTIESVFNGCVPLVRHNVGSDALIDQHSPCFWSDIAELANKLTFSLASNDAEYQKLRSSISVRYSPEVLAQRFIEYFGLKAPGFEEEC